MTPPSLNRHVVFYDGVCGLCNRTVQILLAIDRHRTLSFAPLQGETAEALRQRRQLPEELDTLFFVENYGADRERISFRSTGVLRILARLGGLWGVASWFRIVPRPFRDFIYRVIARYRYRWFGKFDTCPMPSADSASRFLE